MTHLNLIRKYIAYHIFVLGSIILLIALGSIILTQNIEIKRI